MGALKIKLSTTRINNVSLFVTVLSACLGMLVVGGTAHAHAQAAQTAEQVSTATDRACVDEVSPEAQRLLYLYAHVRPAKDIVPATENFEQVLTENTKALVSNNSILVITRLPRAGLNLLPEQPAAN